MAVEDLLLDPEWKDVVAKITDVASSLSRSTTVAGQLAKYTHLLPITRNATRWSSAGNMIHRYVELVPILTDPRHRELNQYGLNPKLNAKAEELDRLLTELTAITKELQKEDLDLLTVRMIFDQIVEKFPQMERRLSKAANIVDVEFRHFESAIVKILSSEEDQLKSQEKKAVKCFEKKEVDVNADDDVVILEGVLPAAG